MVLPHRNAGDKVEKGGSVKKLVLNKDLIKIIDKLEEKKVLTKQEAEEMGRGVK